jgi:hypothetical protein
VSARAIVTALYSRLPANGSELVLFDINRNSKVAPLFRPAAGVALDRILPPAPRQFRTTVIADAGPGGDEVVERRLDPDQAVEQIRPLDLVYPRDIYSLSHIALPFPTADGLYGTHPDPADDFGINLGAVETRGERNTLTISLDSLLRMSSNPFFAYMIERIGESYTAQTRPSGGTKDASRVATHPAPDEATWPPVSVDEGP